MKTRTINKYLLIIAILWSSIPARAYQWELGLRVMRNGQPAALMVYLYEPNNLNVPIRMGYSVAGWGDGVNFRCDIKDPGYTQEPNCDSTQWVYIKPGTYILRIENKWASLTIDPMEPGLNRDFTILNNESGFAWGTGDRYYLGGTENWSSTTTAAVTIDQKLSSGVTAGTIYHVFTNGFEIWTNGTYTTFPVSQFSTITLRADRSIVDGERYNNWNSLDDVTNHKAFQISNAPTPLVANFAPISTSSTITACFVDLPNVTPDSIAFRDPWYVDYVDESYNGLLRNSGVDAPYKMRSCPFTPDAATIFDGVSAYGGTFLNQNALFEANTPVYSVGAPPPQLLNGIPSFLLHWSGTGVAFQDATACSTDVVFTGTSSTVTANYKLHLGSSVSTASGCGNQRKTCYSLDRYHLVYESAGEIWYCNSTDDGSTWSKEVRLSDGSGLNRQPSIACDPKAGAFPYVAVVWEKYESANALSTIYISRQTGSNQWESPQPVGDYHSGVTPGFAGAFPVLTLEPDMETVAWAMSCDGQFVGNSGIHVWYHDIMNDCTDMDIMGGTDGSSQFPSICEHPYINTNGVIGIAWAHGGEIKYTRATYDFDRQVVQYSGCETVSNGSSLEDHSKPSLTIERYSSSWRPVVAWQAYNDITGYTAILQRRRESGGWGTITQYAKADDFSSPSIVPYESSVNLSMTWFEPDNEALHLAKYTGSWGSRIDLSASGRCPTLGYDGSGANTHFRTLYTSGANAPYSLGTTNQSLPKSGSANSEVVMRSVTAIADGIARTFTVKAIALSSDGAKTPIAFVDAPDSLVAESAEDAAGFLTTEPVTIPQGATLIVDWESSSALKDSKASSTGAQVIGTLEMSDASTGKVLSKTTLDTVASDVGTFKTRSARYGIGGLASKKVIARFYPKATGKNAASWSLCTIHYDSSKGANGLVKQSSEDIVEAIPTVFDLSANYPNPFNPSTQVGFALPKDAVVSLMVYDVLGREIAQLARGAYSAGYHSLRWDASSHASGVYYARLSVSDDFGNLLFTKTSKMLLAK